MRKSVLVVIAVIIVVGWSTDHRSCLRQAKPRANANRAVEANRDFIAHAIRARTESAANERPGSRQWQVDTQAVAAYTRDKANQRLTPLPNCDKLLPDL